MCQFWGSTRSYIQGSWRFTSGPFALDGDAQFHARFTGPLDG